MRGVAALLVAGYIGLGVVGVQNVREWLFPQQAMSAASFAPVDTTRVPVGLDRKVAKSSRVHSKRINSMEDELPLSDVALNEFPILRTEAVVPTSGFPSKNDLAVGASGVQVRAKYGEPTARVTEVRGGRVFEHYYYFNRDRTQLTTATLESGVIVSTESTLP